LKLSIVDQSPVPAGHTSAEALRNTIELARLAEALGYHRYWIAEHHATAAFASPAPEIMIARVAAETSSMRVGSGGVMLPHYSPMKVVEQFKVLHALYPGRIDLGLGRAPGGSPVDSFALRRDREHQPADDDFPRQLMELLAFMNRGFRPDHPFSRIELSPEMPGGPEVWMLGSSMWSAAAAGQVGLPYAFAHFIDPVPTRQAIEYYRSHFRASEGLAKPVVVLALGAIAAATEDEAKRLFSSVRVFGRRIRQGIRSQIPPVEEAVKELENKSGPDRPDNGEWPRIVIGEANDVRDRLIDMASVLGAEEVMIVTITHDHQARLNSYRLLAKAFGLTPRPAPDPVSPS
jgi:luciferase family oxidoreductase group 1